MSLAFSAISLDYSPFAKEALVKIRTETFGFVAEAGFFRC